MAALVFPESLSCRGTEKVTMRTCGAYYVIHTNISVHLKIQTPCVI